MTGFAPYLRSSDNAVKSLRSAANETAVLPFESLMSISAVDDSNSSSRSLPLSPRMILCIVVKFYLSRHSVSENMIRSWFSLSDGKRPDRIFPQALSAAVLCAWSDRVV